MALPICLSWLARVRVRGAFGKPLENWHTTPVRETPAGVTGNPIVSQSSIGINQRPNSGENIIPMPAIKHESFPFLLRTPGRSRGFCRTSQASLGHMDW